MTRTADRGLLQHLGFNDPDKGLEEHDLACRYIVQPATMAKLVELLGLWKDGWPVPDRADPNFNPKAFPLQSDGKTYHDISAEVRNEGRVEVTITKPDWRGGPGYFIGFADARIEACARYSATRNGALEQIKILIARIGVEVKIGQVPLGAAIRQVKLYGEYLRDHQWVLATRYRISASERQTLKAEGITHIRLADGFDTFLEQERTPAAAESPEL